jgi:hypothetical protein
VLHQGPQDRTGDARTTSAARRAWAASGAMWLTGRPDGPPLVAPDDLVERIQQLGQAVRADGLDLVVERARAAGLSRGGSLSCGGFARILPCADGWIACSLARPEDVELLPAWFDEPVGVAADPWTVVETLAARRTAAELVIAAAPLGLPVAALGEVPAEADPVGRQHLSNERRRRHRPLVVDLSSLWAGPLCARLLGELGAEVVKVESTTRPDGARLGPDRFYDRLHHGHETVALDFTDPADLDVLFELVATADVVIEGSRPRALEQLGIHAAELAAAGPIVWVSITAHGREGAARHRSGFGDDAAVAGGLVAWDEGGPCFVADAIADPLTGMAAASEATAAVERGGGWLLDVSLSRIAAHVAGVHGASQVRWTAGRATGEAAPLGPPPPAPGRAPKLGEHTDQVLSRLAIDPGHPRRSGSSGGG